jgi:F-type H+-transporting ATPase subunit epsilon
MSTRTGASLRCVVVTPESTALDIEADSAVFTAEDGEIGIFAGRSPLVARLRPGELRLTTAAEVNRFFVDGGFAQVKNNVLTILTPRAFAQDQLNVADLEEQLKKAVVQTAAGDAVFERMKSIDRLRGQIRVARSGKSSRGH